MGRPKSSIHDLVPKLARQHQLTLLSRSFLPRPPPTAIPGCSRPTIAALLFEVAARYRNQLWPLKEPALTGCRPVAHRGRPSQSPRRLRPRPRGTPSLTFANTTPTHGRCIHTSFRTHSALHQTNSHNGPWVSQTQLSVRLHHQGSGVLSPRCTPVVPHDLTNTNFEGSTRMIPWILLRTGQHATTTPG